MLNPIDAYRDAGDRAGRASKLRDVALVQHEKRWLARALMDESSEDRREARRVFDEAYRAQATPTVSYFR